MRVYTFLDGPDDTLDGVRAQVVLLSLIPMIEQAYGYIRRDATCQGIITKGINTNSLAMVSRGYKTKKSYEKQAYQGSML
jgi:hypothetical protein